MPASAMQASLKMIAGPRLQFKLVQCSHKLRELSLSSPVFFSFFKGLKSEEIITLPKISGVIMFYVERQQLNRKHSCMILP